MQSCTSLAVLALLVVGLSACAQSAAPPATPPATPTATAPVAGLPGAGDTIRIIHPANDAKFGELVTLAADGTVSVDRSGARRSGTWETTECGLFTTRSCLKVRSALPSGTVLQYDIYSDGTLDAAPSGNRGWKWRMAGA